MMRKIPHKAYPKGFTLLELLRNKENTLRDGFSYPVRSDKQRTEDSSHAKSPRDVVGLSRPNPALGDPN